jgi:hypothetical protein
VCADCSEATIADDFSRARLRLILNTRRRQLPIAFFHLSAQDKEPLRSYLWLCACAPTCPMVPALNPFNFPIPIFALRAQNSLANKQYLHT